MMPPAPVMAVAALLGALYLGAKPTYNHVIRPTGCFFEKVGTLGHKHCKPYAKKQKHQQQQATPGGNR